MERARRVVVRMAEPVEPIQRPNKDAVRKPMRGQNSVMRSIYPLRR